MTRLSYLMVLMSFCLTAFAQEAVPPLRSSSFAVSPAAGSEVRGTVYVADYGLGNTTLVVVSLSGTAGTHPAHFHAGDCGSGGAIVVPLEAVDGATGLSTTVTTAPFELILEGDHYLNIHASPEAMGTIVACGEIGAGANELSTPPGASPDAGAAGASVQGTGTATGVRDEEFETRIPTAGYGVFEVASSGVAGQVQVSGRAEGGTRIVVSLDGTQAGQDYPAAIRSGDCGPDGETVLELTFPISPAEPGVGETNSSLTFEALTEADNYLQIYAPDDPNRVIACGEVGIGANR